MDIAADNNSGLECRKRRADFIAPKNAPFNYRVYRKGGERYCRTALRSGHDLVVDHGAVDGYDPYDDSGLRDQLPSDDVPLKEGGVPSPQALWRPGQRCDPMATILPQQPTRSRALMAYSLSVATILAGMVLASRRFPGGLDWVYTVMSALASRKHNPQGAAYFAAGISVALALLWPAASWVGRRDDASRGLARFGLLALRTGIVLGVLVGVERLVFHHFSQILRKGHEALSLLAFLSLYAGVLSLHANRARRGVASLWSSAVAIAPLVAIGISQLYLYLDQRDLGWVDRSWRDMGVSRWLSFAFWQWLAAAALWASVGHLVVARRAASDRPPELDPT